MKTKRQQQRQKQKPLDPWPAWDSPERIKYPDRPELTEEVYRKAGQHFTAEAFNEVKAALSPPRNFDLLKRLRRAVYTYHLFTAAREGKIDLIEEHRPKDHARALDELIARTAEYLKYVEERPGAFLSIADPSEDWLYLQSLLSKIRENAEKARQKIDTGKTGPQKGLARRGYENYLCKIFEEARREPMTSRTDSYLEKPYGPAFDFFSAAFKLIGLNRAPNSINKYLKDTIQKQDEVNTSKHL